MSDRIFGDVRAFARKLRSRLTAGAHILDELESAAGRIAPDDASGLIADVRNAMVLDPVANRVASWSAGNGRLLATHLGAAAHGRLPEWRRKEPREAERVTLARLAATVREDSGILQEILGNLPARRGAVAVDHPVSLDVLWASRIIDPELLRAYEHRMAVLGTPAGRSAAIGAAKELLESTFRAALRVMNEPDPPPDTDFGPLSRKVQRALEARGAAPDEKGRETYNRLQSGIGTVVQAVGRARNLYGAGHGRIDLPGGLAERHARFVLDLAVAYTRFVVATLDDLGLLPG